MDFERFLSVCGSFNGETVTDYKSAISGPVTDCKSATSWAFYGEIVTDYKSARSGFTLISYVKFFKKFFNLYTINLYWNLIIPPAVYWNW